MKIHSKGTPQKVDADMTPMIDVVFQLLIFFMLTLKIIEPEGDFNINMPIGAPGQSDATIPPLTVRLTSLPSGRLEQVRFNNRALGNDENAFQLLSREILQIVGPPGSVGSEEMEVEIDADYALDNEFLIRAISAVSGEVNPNTKQVVRYVQKIKFAPPRKPGAAASP